MNALGVFVYILPQLFAGLYFQAKSSGRPFIKWTFSFFLFCMAAGMLVGIVAATMGMWLPRI